MPEGLLPPDGVPWPPEPEAVPPVHDDPDDWSWDAPPARPRDADGAIGDWRSLPVEDAPPGYRGSSSAPPPPPARLEPWAVVGVVCAVAGAVPLGWKVPALPVLAIAFGLVARRNCQHDPTRVGRSAAVVAVAVGAATLMVIALLVSTGRLRLGL